MDAWDGFLGCPTPAAWVRAALGQLDVLLLDHRNNEFKAAASALALMARYPLHARLAQAMSRLAREELVHHHQVSRLLAARGIELRLLPAGRYAASLHQYARKSEPERLLDTLVLGAFIELRSCERFAALVPVLDDELASFYAGLLASERRHHHVYLDLACAQAGESAVAAAVDRLRPLEAQLILAEDGEFRFHSGPPPASSC